MLNFLVIRHPHLGEVLFSQTLVFLLFLNEFFFAGLEEFKFFQLVFIHVFLVNLLSLLVGHLAFLLLLKG